MKWHAVILRGFGLFCSVTFASFHTIEAPQPFVQSHIKCTEWLYIVISLPEESKGIKKNAHRGLEQKEVFIFPVPSFCATQHHDRRVGLA